MRLNIDRLDAGRKGWAGQIGDERGQAREVLMNGVKPGDCPIILDSQVNFPAFCVRKADDCSDQIAVAEPIAIALELDGQTLALGDVASHLTIPFLRSSLPIDDHSYLPSSSVMVQREMEFPDCVVSYWWRND